MTPALALQLGLLGSPSDPVGRFTMREGPSPTIIRAHTKPFRYLGWALALNLLLNDVPQWFVLRSSKKYAELLPQRILGPHFINYSAWRWYRKRSMVKRAIHGAREIADMEPDQVFELAAEVFRVMSAPMRLKIISSLCQGEKNVSELLTEIKTTQPNMSQHLNTLYHAGVLGKRREGVQIHYRIIDERVANLCRSVCTQIAIEDGSDPL